MERSWLSYEVAGWLKSFRLGHLDNRCRLRELFGLSKSFGEVIGGRENEDFEIGAIYLQVVGEAAVSPRVHAMRNNFSSNQPLSRFARNPFRAAPPIFST